ncbi:MAG: signal peptidase I [Pseudanabaenaceae cyanobacterium bins.68]|nr:signal peptidase I [Pseudanabaenaceae cyanobacterium bins.68]
MTIEPNSSDSPTEPIAKQRQKSKGWRGLIEENGVTVITAVALAFGVRWFIAEPRYIPSSSMEPTLQINDRLIIEKISYRFRPPQRGEIVVFYPPNTPVVPDNTKVYIKRLIGLPGDQISITQGKVYINGEAIPEPYIAEPPAYQLPNLDPNNPDACPNCFVPERLNLKPQPSFTVPANSYWVMGDNRNNSLDSHAWGFLPAENLVGRAVFRYWPPDSRFGDPNSRGK